jgi:hypothetical protein
MVEGVEKGTFAHVVGTFDLTQKTGTIDYVTPVRTAVDSSDVQDEGIHLIGQNEAGKQLFDQVVNPQRNSCAPNAQAGTFEEFVPVTPDLRSIILRIGGSIAAEFSRGNPAAPGAIAFGASSPDAPHKLALDNPAGPAPAPGVTYTVQAKADQDRNWQTLAVGLPTPTMELDVNQFPGAKSVNVRVLRTDGFSETEVFKATKDF